MPKIKVKTLTLLGLINLSHNSIVISTCQVDYHFTMLSTSIHITKCIVKFFNRIIIIVNGYARPYA